MEGASASKAPIERFSQAEIAPDGEWWYEFSVGLELQGNKNLEMGDRRIDGICVASRNQRTPEWQTRSQTRENRESGWLDSEEVVIVEHGTGSGAWAKYGQMDIRKRMFEMDWPDTSVKKSILLMEVQTPGGNKDTQWIFENLLDGFEYVVEYDGEFYEYGDFLSSFS